MRPSCEVDFVGILSHRLFRWMLSLVRNILEGRIRKERQQVGPAVAKLRAQLLH
jgi:hypothetical protein